MAGLIHSHGQRALVSPAWDNDVLDQNYRQGGSRSLTQFQFPSEGTRGYTVIGTDRPYWNTCLIYIDPNPGKFTGVNMGLPVNACGGRQGQNSRVKLCSRCVVGKLALHVFRLYFRCFVSMYTFGCYPMHCRLHAWMCLGMEVPCLHTINKIVRIVYI